MKALFYLTFTLFSSDILVAQSQTASTLNSPQTISSDVIDWANFENEMAKMGEEDWSFHTDQESKLLYIDFESLGSKMHRMVLMCQEKKVLMEDNNLFDLPINTIYEVNLEKLERGSYFVELYTYDEKIIREQITIN
jgi:hypothetical protein